MRNTARQAVPSETAGNSPEPVGIVDLASEHRFLGRKLKREVQRILETGQFVLGRDLSEFENAFAAYCGVGYGAGTNSGSSAIELALRACGIGPGDEVIVPAHTFIASVMAVLNVGATPVLVDVEPRAFSLDIDLAAKAVTARSKAVLVVHLYGQMADMGALEDLARGHDLLLIEDAAQAHGAAFRNRKAGSFGACGCFSFYPTKNLGAAGDAGMVVTSNASLARRLKRLRNHGRSSHDRFVEVGFNERMDNLQAAILNVKLPNLEEWNDRRRKHAALYDRLLAGLPLSLPEELPGRRHVYHQYVVRARRRSALAKHLESRAIGTAVHYASPLHRQPALRDLGPLAGRFPVTERLAREVLSLPVHPYLREKDVRRVAREITAFFG